MSDRPTPERIAAIREDADAWDARGVEFEGDHPQRQRADLLAEIDALQADHESAEKLISFLLFFVNKETIQAIVEGTAKHFAGHAFVHPETGDKWDVIAQRHEGKTPIEIASAFKEALVLLEAELRPFAENAASVASYEEAFELMTHWHGVAKTALDPASALDAPSAKDLGWEVPPAAPIPVVLSGVKDADVALDAPDIAKGDVVWIESYDRQTGTWGPWFLARVLDAKDDEVCFTTGDPWGPRADVGGSWTKREHVRRVRGDDHG